VQLVKFLSTSPTAFECHGVDRLIEWKQFRETLEIADDPLRSVADYWAKAPFVSSYLDPFNPKSWPDPWHLILDLKLDDLAIALGMLYTLRLTERFMDIKLEIHKSMLPETKQTKFPVIVDDKWLLNWEYRGVLHIDQIAGIETVLLYSDCNRYK
jgi:hypothetical protein